MTYGSEHVGTHFLLSRVIDVHGEGPRASPVKAGKTSSYLSVSGLCYLGMLHQSSILGVLAKGNPPWVC